MRTTVSAVAAVLCFLLSQTLAFSAQPQATLDVTVSAAATGVQTVDGCPIYTAGDYFTETNVALDANSASRIASYGASSVGGLTLQVQSTWHINAYASPTFYTDHSTSGHAPLSGGFPWSSSAVISEHNSDDHGESLDTTNCVGYGGYWGNGASNINNTTHDITFYASQKTNLRGTLANSGYGGSSDLDMAGGIPVIPGMLVYQQYATDGAWKHALVLVVGSTGTCTSGFKAPANSNNGQAYSGPSGDAATCLRYGDHLRLHSSYNCTGYSAQNQAICTTMKTYGVFVDDAANSALKLAADDDSRWGSTSQLGGIRMSDFDVLAN
jgi:FlaG/FlaF family flagellin (archaellin)